MNFNLICIVFHKKTRYYCLQKVETVTKLSAGDAEYPLTGAVSVDEKTVYWTSTGGNGHLVKSMGIPDGKLSEAKIITGGPTVVAHLELSTDEQELYLADVDMGLIERVKISGGDISFVTEYGEADFFPGMLCFVLYCVTSLYLFSEKFHEIQYMHRYVLQRQ